MKKRNEFIMGYSSILSMYSSNNKIKTITAKQIETKAWQTVGDSLKKAVGDYERTFAKGR